MPSKKINFIVSKECDGTVPLVSGDPPERYETSCIITGEELSTQDILDLQELLMIFCKFHQIDYRPQTL